MTDMLTAKDVQELLQVDRSTVYRMAEAGQLPAIKVGKQWRFPEFQIEEWMSTQMGTPVPAASIRNVESQTQLQKQYGEEASLVRLLPLECVQLIQDSHADLLGVMLVITDMEGVPLTEPSHPCGLFATISQKPNAVQRCISSWHDLGQAPTIEPTFHLSHLGLLCARGLIRVGTELKGMVVAGCIAPDEWPPSDESVQRMADDFGVDSKSIVANLNNVYLLNTEQKKLVLSSVQRVADIAAHIIKERRELVGRLETIADLAQLR